MSQNQDLVVVINSIQTQLINLFDRSSMRIYNHADYLAIDRFIQDLNSIKVSKDKSNQALNVVCMVLEDEGCRYGKDQRTVTMISLLSLMVLYTALYNYFPKIKIPTPFYADSKLNFITAATAVENACYPSVYNEIIWLDVSVQGPIQLKTAIENKLASILVGP